MCTYVYPRGVVSTSQSPTAVHLEEFELGVVHHAQWQAAELCYRWLVEWEDVEIREASQLAQLRSHLDVVAREIQAAVTEVERVQQEMHTG